MLKQLQKLKVNQQLFLLFAVIVLLCSLFCRRGVGEPAMYARFGAGLGPLKGGINLEAYENSLENSMNKPSLTLFYAPWCGYCKRLMPTWDKFVKKNGNNGKVVIIKVNCEENKDLGKKFEVKSYPTIKYLPGGLNSTDNVVEFKGDRSVNSLTQFLNRFT